MKKATISFLAALAAISTAGTARAQPGPTTPISVEVRGGLAFPGGEDMEGREVGIVFGGDVIFQVTPMIGIYGGYAFQTWAVESEEDLDDEFKGFEAGARLSFSSLAGGFSPFLKGGALYQKPALSADDGSLEGDYELGFQVGGGVDVRLGNRLSFTPQASFNSVEEAQWVNLEAGLRIRL